MGTIKVLSLTVEQAAELANGQNAHEITSVETAESKGFIQRLTQNLKNGIAGLCGKVGNEFLSEDPAMRDTINGLMDERVQEIEEIKSETKEDAPKRMTDREYRCYLNSVVFGGD